MSKVHTHYDNLKVSRDAPLEVIKAAYKSLSMKFHPDRNPDDPTAVKKMQLINLAYETLSDPAKRAGHDLWIAEREAEIAAETDAARNSRFTEPESPFWTEPPPESPRTTEWQHYTYEQQAQPTPHSRNAPWVNFLLFVVAIGIVGATVAAGKWWIALMGLGIGLRSANKDELKLALADVWLISRKVFAYGLGTGIIALLVIGLFSNRGSTQNNTDPTVYAAPMQQAQASTPTSAPTVQVLPELPASDTVMAPAETPATNQATTLIPAPAATPPSQTIARDKQLFLNALFVQRQLHPEINPNSSSYSKQVDEELANKVKAALQESNGNTPPFIVLNKVVTTYFNEHPAQSYAPPPATFQPTEEAMPQQNYGTPQFDPNQTHQ